MLFLAQIRHLDLDAPSLFAGLYEQERNGLWDKKTVQCSSGNYVAGDYGGWKRWRNSVTAAESRIWIPFSDFRLLHLTSICMQHSNSNCRQAQYVTMQNHHYVMTPHPKNIPYLKNTGPENSSPQVPNTGPENSSPQKTVGHTLILTQPLIKP